MESTSNVRKDDRTLVLKPIEGQLPRATSGIVDQRLFKGGNTLHAMIAPNCLWVFKYEAGLLPEPLKQSFTTFKALMEHGRKYFASRGIEIVEVID